MTGSLSKLLMSYRSRPRQLLGLTMCVLALLGVAAQDPSTLPEKPQRKPDENKIEGRLIRVPLPITGNVDTRVRNMIQRAVGRFHGDGRRPVIVLEFSPGQTEYGEGTKFTRALELAQFLSSREMARVKTVAYIPRTIKGHGVLVAMACEEIVMSPEAVFGEAGIDEPPQQPIEPAVLSSYKQFADRRRTIPIPLALGMLDRELEVLKVQTEVSVEIVLRRDLEALKQDRAVQSVEVLAPQGELAQFNGREGRELGFVKYLADNREAVAKALELPEEALREDPSLGGAWNPVTVPIDEPIDEPLVSRLKSMIDDELRMGEVNFILIRLDSPGGSLAYSLELANYLASLDPSAVRTVAYVKQAQSDAALVAMACDHLVMHPNSTLGGTSGEPIARDEIDPAVQSIREVLAKEKGRNWSLTAALIDPELKVYEYRNKTTGQIDYFSPAEFDEQDDADLWKQGPEVTTNDRPLEVNGERAKEVGLAWEVVDDFEEFKQLYGLEGDPRLVEPGWADFLIEALARPRLAWLLLFLGGIALYAELQAPGIGIGGFLATVCFLLFFWSNILHGTAGWLEVMLFLGGVGCLLIEIFVLPGFGIFGLGGGLMVITSLILASQTFILPHDQSQMNEFRDSLAVVVGAMVAILIGGMVLRRYLPHTPFFNRIMLAPPEEEPGEPREPADSDTDFVHLLGQTGVAATQLTPSGKARFADQIVDVITDGDVVSRGSPVVVVEVRGNHVLVQEIVRQ